MKFPLRVRGRAALSLFPSALHELPCHQEENKSLINKLYLLLVYDKHDGVSKSMLRFLFFHDIFFMTQILDVKLNIKPKRFFLMGQAAKSTIPHYITLFNKDNICIAGGTVV